MALSKAQLKSRIVQEMKQQGATDTGEHSWLNRMAEAPELQILDIRAVGDDWQITAVPKAR